MKVECWPAEGYNNAVAQYRILMPAQALMDQGADVAYNWRGPNLLWDQYWDASGGKRPPPHVKIMGLASLPEADIVVMQRPTERWWAEMIPFLQEAGIKVVVDMDDFFAQLDEGHVGKAAFKKRETGFNATHNSEWASQACLRADLVTCTTPALLKRYGFGHGVILPNYVPERYFDAFGYGPMTAGWSGSVGTHPKDLQVTGGAVQDALSATDWRFHVVGSGVRVQELLGLSEEPTTSGWVPFAEYMLEMARMEVGIVPLADTAFNRAKSGLKVMEMTTVGAATVSSPTFENQRLADLGIGLTATNPGQWRKKLKALMANDGYRIDLASRGREAMRQLTYERNCGRWWDAWSKVFVPGAKGKAAWTRLDRLEQVGAG